MKRELRELLGCAGGGLCGQALRRPGGHTFPRVSFSKKERFCVTSDCGSLPRSGGALAPGPRTSWIRAQVRSQHRRV